MSRCRVNKRSGPGGTGKEKPHAAGFGTIAPDRELALYLEAQGQDTILRKPGIEVQCVHDPGVIWEETGKTAKLSKWTSQIPDTDTKFKALFTGLLQVLNTTVPGGKPKPGSPSLVPVDFGAETSDIDIDSDTDNTNVPEGTPPRRARSADSAKQAIEDKWESVGDGAASSGDVGMIMMQGETWALVDIAYHAKVRSKLKVESDDSSKVEVKTLAEGVISEEPVEAGDGTRQYLVRPALDATPTTSGMAVKAILTPVPPPAANTEIFGTPVGEVKDEFKVNIRPFVLKPQRGDFTAGKEGRIMISTKEDDVYYTPAQTEDGKVTITADLGPASSPFQYRNIFFRIVDPPDASPYATPPSNGGTFSLSAFTDFGGVQEAGCWKVATQSISGRELAKAVLNITDRYSGDNYIVKAAIGAAPSDSLSDNQPKTALLTAWKRLYLEHDRMYTKGATVLGCAGNVLTVDSVADFTVGNDIMVWDNSNHIRNTTVTAIDAANKRLTADLAGISFAIYSGVKLANSDTAYYNNMGYVKDGFGNATSGTDGGAFVEFTDLVGGSGGIPKYTDFTSYGVLQAYLLFWRNYRDRPNVIQLATGNTWSGTPATAKGFGDRVNNWSIVFWGGATGPDDTFYTEAVVHELGHQVTVATGHVDQTTAVPNHAGSGSCVMTYVDQRDGVAEFCKDHLMEVRGNVDAE